MDYSSLKLETEDVGALPIVRKIVDRLAIGELLQRHAPAARLGRMCKLPNAKALEALLYNVLLSRQPLYGLREWFQDRAVDICGLNRAQANLLNDDRIARALDRLFDHDPASLVTEVITRAVSEFDLQLDQIHTDTTSVTFSGRYQQEGRSPAGKVPPRITYGYNKDHRPDLKQLINALTVTADGAVPVHHRIYNGNTTDDKTYLDAWCAIRRLRGDPRFLFVADSKLCTRENMRYIENEGGKFLTVLPRSRKEDDDFREHLARQGVPSTEILRQKPVRDPEGGDQIYHAYDWDRRSVEGYRIIWYLSSTKAQEDARRRASRIDRARERIAELEARTGAHRFRSVATAQAAAAQVLQEEGVQRWLELRVTEDAVTDYTQIGPGRPGKHTRYRRLEHPIVLFDVVELADPIQADAKCDGVFAMVTNEDSLSALELLKAYKYQSFLEKRHEQLKSVLAVAPVWLKKSHRVAAVLVVYLLAVLIFALIEREVRRQMKARGIPSLPLYPEERICKAPTTEVIFRAFEGVRRSHLLDPDGNVLRTFVDPLSRVARDLAQMLGLAPRSYGS